MKIASKFTFRALFVLICLPLIWNSCQENIHSEQKGEILEVKKKQILALTEKYQIPSVQFTGSDQQILAIDLDSLEVELKKLHDFQETQQASVDSMASIQNKIKLEWEAAKTQKQKLEVLMKYKEFVSGADLMKDTTDLFPAQIKK